MRGVSLLSVRFSLTRCRYYPHPIGNTTVGSRLGQIAVIEKRERDRFRHPVQKK
jgi:hypothetical protein